MQSAATPLDGETPLIREELASNDLLLVNTLFRQEKVRRLEIDVNVQDFDFLDVVFHQ